MSRRPRSLTLAAELLQTVRSKLGDGPTVVWECRHCGASLDGDRAACPRCGWDAVTRYEID